MQQVRGTTLIRVIFLAASIFFISFNTALAQNKRTANAAPAGDEPTLQALLKEMRLLRITLQRMNLQAYRVQTTLEHIRIQQDYVDRLARRLDEARKDLVDVKQSHAQSIERAKDLEEKIKVETDEGDRSRAELVLKDLQFDIQQQDEKEQSMHIREGQLASQLQSEQFNLDELNKRLDKLEREMETPISPEASQPRKP